MSILDILKDWQTLISGLMALSGAAVVVWVSQKQMRQVKKNRDQDRIDQEKKVINVIKAVYSKVIESIDLYRENNELREGVEVLLRKGNVVRAPMYPSKSRMLESALIYLQAHSDKVDIVILLSEIVELHEEFRASYKLYSSAIDIYTASNVRMIDRTQMTLFEAQGSRDHELQRVHEPQWGQYSDRLNTLSGKIIELSVALTNQICVYYPTVGRSRN